jgi:predicted dehydrogenase
MQRRRFLKASFGAVGASFAFPHALRAAALGKGGRTAPSDRVIMGAIGVGSMGHWDVRHLMDTGDTQFVGVCDVVRGRREKMKKFIDGAYGSTDCAMFKDFRDLLARDDLDAVSITTQDHWHAPITTAAARAGLDMYCQKPLGMTVQECQVMVETVRKHKVVFQTGTQQRSGRNFRFACELARNGYLGRIHTVNVAAPGPMYKRSYKKPPVKEPIPDGMDFDMYVGPAPMRPYNGGLWAWPDWYLIRDYCVGFIVNWGVHHLDIANWGCPTLATEPCSVQFGGSYRKDGLTDNINDWTGVFQYRSGLKMLYSDTGNPHKQGCEFVGDKGRVHVNRKGISATPDSLLSVKIKPDEIHLQKGRAGTHYANFVHAVRTRKDPIAPVEAGFQASIMGMIAEISIKLGKELQWDPATKRFAKDDLANRLLSRTMRSPWRL